jgi:uncharacterized protein with NRDE domain
MCLILFAYNVHPSYPLILAANRDEYYERPTQMADFWQEELNLLAGKDLKAGGTWLGITRDGRFGALTNYRDPAETNINAPTRGSIVIDFLRGSQPPEQYLNNLANCGIPFNKFSVLLGTIPNLYYYTNAKGKFTKVSKGIHGLCNHLLDTPWPKVVRGKKKLTEIVTGKDSLNIDNLLNLLADQEIAPEDHLPETGVRTEFEKVLSPIFITSPTYGTRCSTVVMVEKTGNVVFVEQNHNIPGTQATRQHYSFSLNTKK